MSKFKKIIMVFVLSTSVFASSEMTFSDFKESLRPYLVKIIGQEYTLKFLGEPPKKLKLPKIPKINEDAKSTISAVKAELDNEKIQKDTEKFNFFYVDEVFKATRNEAATKEEVGQWMNALKQGASRDGLYRSIVLGGHYRGLESFENAPTDEAIGLTSLILNKYLSLEAEPEALSKLNIYTLKRITVEKCLEVIDAFASKSKDDLSTWYGILSAELAEKYGSLWKNKLRTEVSEFKHKEWAQKVPLQHIKSEVIIKLHMAFNSLK
jgi:hypothetical protein